MIGLSSGSSTAFRTTGIGADVLMGWYVARANTAALAGSPAQLSGASSGRAQSVDDVAPPWDPDAAPSPSEDLARRALATGLFLDDEGYDGYSDTDAPQSQKQLFALHQALKKLTAIAGESADKTTLDGRRNFLDRRFQEGMAQVAEFLSTAEYTEINVVAREPRLFAETQTVILRGSDIYATGVLHDGDFDAEVDGFLGARTFSITVHKNGADTNIDIDLSEMGATTRSLDNVADYINTKLDAAGMATKFKRVKIGEPDEDGVIAGSRFGFEVQGILTEKLSFSSAASGSGAIYLAGTSGHATDDTTMAGQLSKFTHLGDAAPVRESSTRFETLADGAVADSDDEDNPIAAIEGDGLSIISAQVGADGGLYVLATTDIATGDNLAVRGEQDVVLARYDSTGKRLWTRSLGASGTAEGRSLAVGADGSITVAGVITGDLGSTIDVGGTDGFVTRFDADGVEQWTQRIGGLSDDAVDSVTVAADGTVYVAGRTRNALGAGPSGGDGNLDAFVRAFDTDGATLWTRQFGDADNERASAVTLADDGSLIVASIEDGEGFVRKFSTADGTSPAVWEYALGDMDEGFISAVHADATGIYITGAARAGMTLASSPVAHSGARDAFVIALDDGANPTVRFETFIGSESEDVARDIVVADGAIYIAGYTDGEMPSGGELIGSRNGFVSKLDATTGSLAWSHQVAGRNGFSEGAALVYQSDGSSDLDVFGLPTGAMFYEDDNTITTRTSARAGDSFYVSVDGGRKRKIIIDADDSYRSLTFKINAVLVLDGKASVSRTSGGDKLMLKPQIGRAHV